MPRLWNTYQTLGFRTPEDKYDVPDNRCVGFAPSKGRKCNNPIACANRDYTYYLLRQLSHMLPNSQDPEIEDLLWRLAECSLCKRNHQDQAFTKVKQWLTAIDDLERASRMQEQVLPNEPRVVQATSSLRAAKPQPKLIVDEIHLDAETQPATILAGAAKPLPESILNGRYIHRGTQTDTPPAAPAEDVVSRKCPKIKHMEDKPAVAESSAVPKPANAESNVKHEETPSDHSQTSNASASDLETKDFVDVPLTSYLHSPQVKTESLSPPTAISANVKEEEEVLRPTPAEVTVHERLVAEPLRLITRPLEVMLYGRRDTPDLEAGIKLDEVSESDAIGSCLLAQRLIRTCRDGTASGLRYLADCVAV